LGEPSARPAARSAVSSAWAVGVVIGDDLVDTGGDDLAVLNDQRPEGPSAAFHIGLRELDGLAEKALRFAHHPLLSRVSDTPRPYPARPSQGESGGPHGRPGNQIEVSTRI
jgi:hypothetical protein